MDFYEVVDKVVDLLKQRGRVSYRALQRQFDLDEAYVEDLKVELIDVQECATDRDNKMLVWSGDIDGTLVATSQRAQTSEQPPAQQDQPRQIAPPPEPHAPEAERRQLTVMFSDVVDSTQLSGQLDPEDYREVLRAYQHACSEVIQRFGGYIAQHLGDALLVYFGFPTAHEDDAQRAMHTGLGMLEAVQTLNTRLEQDKGIRLAIRVGMHTGLTVVGDIGEGPKHEMLALGEAPNIASRLQGLAEPDTIAISADTYRLVEGYFTVDDLGVHTLKGVTEPQQVYRVLGESGAQSRLDIASARGLTPLVGREQEVGFLLERWAQVKQGMGQVVLLSGEGGIGKSRLVQVLKDDVADEPYTRLECRSSPYYANTALYPMTDMLQRTLRCQADDPPEQLLEKLEEALSYYRLPLQESVPLFAPLLSLALPEDRYPSLNLSPQRQRQKTLESIIVMLLEQAEQQPVLFIIEDLHWLDPTSLELLDLIIDQVPTASVFILLTCRPIFQPTWSSRSYLTQMTLNRLSRRHIAHMAEQVADGKTLPDDVLQQIVEKTDGVPLFVEEMTKAVLESDYLQELGGQHALTGPVTSLAIPATLQDSLMARLDRLKTAKVIAQLGATIGRQFSYGLLREVAQLDEGTLHKELSQLVDAELLYQRGLPPQATYTFKHALIQDTAYESLLRSTRQGYHRRIAGVFAERFPETVETQPELLAHHYTEAGLAEPAVDYWQRAGEHAIERSANVEAMSHLTKGLEVLQLFPATPQSRQQELVLLTVLGTVLATMKGYGTPEVEQTYLRAHSLCQQIGEAFQLFSVLRGLWNCAQARGEFRVAYAFAEDCLRSAQRTQEAALLVEAHWMMCSTLMWRGEFARALEHVEQGLARHDPHDHTFYALQNRSVAFRCYGAVVLWYLGYPDQACVRSDEALSRAQALSHPYSAIYSHFHAARVYHLRRERYKTQEQADAAIMAARAYGSPFFEARGTVLRGWALADQGQGREGIAQIHQGMSEMRALGTVSGESGFLCMLANGYQNTGQIEEGLVVLSEALAHVETTEENYHEAELHRLKGQLLLQQSSDNHAEAASCFEKALTIARNQHAKSWELRAATSLAHLWQQQNKRQEAIDLLAPVYGWFTEGFDTADLIDAKTLLDELQEESVNITDGSP